MKFLNPKDDTPPFDQWIFLDVGGYFTFGRILKHSPNDGSVSSEFLSFKNGEYSYMDYQFFIQDMTTKHDIPSVRSFDGEFFDSDCLNDFSDSIKAWAVLPY